MKATHPIETSGIRVVDIVDDYSHVELHDFHVEDSEDLKGGPIAGISCHGGLRIWGVGETAVVFGEPHVEDSGMPKAVRERHGHRLHPLFFAVYDRPPYVPLVVYYLDTEQFDRELDNERPEEAPNDRKPDSCIRITVLETPDGTPTISSTIFL